MNFGEKAEVVTKLAESITVQHSVGTGSDSIEERPEFNLERREQPRSPLRLLYFAPHQALPINTGGRLRDYQLARQLGARCSVTFAEMRHGREERRKSSGQFGLESVITLNKGRTYSPSKILRGLVGPIPVTVLNCWSPRMASQLTDAFRSYQFDSVQVEGVHLMEYLPVIHKTFGTREIVIDWHNIESELMWRYAGTPLDRFKKLAARRTAILIERAEERLLNACATHTVTSERERQKLLARRPGANIKVVPNGVDVTYYSSDEMARATSQSGGDHSEKTIVFVGSMDYHANVDAVMWFSRTIWPEIAKKYPDCHFTIVGRDPGTEVRSLASDRIQVTGTVDDVRPFYAAAVVAVVPIRSGGGTRLKILEAMAAGVPVVSTRLGAEGIDAEHDNHILLADSIPEMTAAIIRIISSPELRSRLVAAARTLVVDRYDWSVIGEQLYRIHCDLARAQQRHRFWKGPQP
jgi:glycosyltransferase involved in cell wall biosynthesis